MERASGVEIERVSDVDDTRIQIQLTLFEGALNLPDPAVRAAFLAQVCRGDPELLRSLESLLDARERAENFFAIDPLSGSGSEPLASMPEETDLPPEPNRLEGSNTRIGRYKLIDRLGDGGCGVVYLAEQQEPVHRQVALKIIRLGMDTERVIARFEMERQALALMNHPNIAQVLDAGATETGRPYFVMELVPGVRITDYCDQHGLDIPSRLELFIEVCLAIQHAHQKGVLHRDIKPSNILIVEHGDKAVPKVIDFGIAKAIEGRLGDKGTVTFIEQFIGTPAYMSPEQAETGGVDVDTRSDIYSLGALLYELLTGRPPFDTDRLLELGVEQMRRELIEKEPLRPSKLLLSLEDAELAEVARKRRCEPARLIAGLKGDLDWIVTTAMEKDRQRRYATVNGLAVDVQRYLHDQPVSARPPSRWYSLGKLVRRNRAAFVAGTAVAAALVIGLGTSTVLFFREREARQQQAKLLAEAEKNEMITHAVSLVRDGKPGEADALLEQIRTPPKRPSFDAVSVFRAVGDWLAVQQRWQEAARRYAFVMHLDEIDIWRPVTLDYQAYAVLLMETGDFSTYAQFCRTTAAKYAGESNGDASGRILKSCLLRPPAAELTSMLQPLAKVTEKEFPRSGSKPWMAIQVSLWHYRCGNYRSAAEFALPKEGQSDTSAATATNCAIFAMALFHEGKVEEARTQLARAQKIVNAEFAQRLGEKDSRMGYWYDWVFARILLREAESTIR
jgi:serine/threonine protein kinase